MSSNDYLATCERLQIMIEDLETAKLSAQNKIFEIDISLEALKAHLASQEAPKGIYPGEPEEEAKPATKKKAAKKTAKKKAVKKATKAKTAEAIEEHFDNPETPRGQMRAEITKEVSEVKAPVEPEVTTEDPVLDLPEGDDSLLDILGASPEPESVLAPKTRKEVGLRIREGVTAHGEPFKIAMAKEFESLTGFKGFAMLPEEGEEVTKVWHTLNKWIEREWGEKKGS